MAEETNEKILKRLDQYRAIEINNLWQRSVFLGAFLVLGYTGYGFLLDKILSFTTVYLSNPNNEICKIEHKSYLALYHLIACALAGINIIFSVLWIAMAKGSKAWYEVYENAIQAMELKINWDYNDLRRSIHLKFAQKDDCIFSTKAGGYSPSKINIAIGQISLVIWITVFIIHLLMSCCDLSYIGCQYTFLIPFGIIVITTALMIRHSSWVQSSYFKD